MNGLYISATQKSSGKTTVTLGLVAALARRGVDVQPFKKGPDYIDPMWLGLAAGKACRNLDFHFMSQEEILAQYLAHSQSADLSIVEGNKGLFDGLDVDGTDSNAALASLLGTPVVLVVDTRGITRGIAPLVKGYTDFDKSVNIVGCILNQVGGPRHESKLRAALEAYTDVPVLGALGRYPHIEIRERHLGLVPANESSAAEDIILATARVIEENVDLGWTGTLSCTDVEQSWPSVSSIIKQARPLKDVTIAIAEDAAFGFYYPDDLEAFCQAGAQLVPFDALNDSHFPDVDGLFIGGGFPETQAEALSVNVKMRQQIKAALDGGMPTYAECGGLMYLSESLTWNGKTHDMVGAVPGHAVMHEKPIGRGYAQLKPTGAGLWADSVPNEAITLPAHEFHYASLEGLPEDAVYAYEMVRGYGVNGKHDGLIIGNIMAGFSHQRNCTVNNWTSRFVDFVRQCRGGNGVMATKAVS